MAFVEDDAELEALLKESETQPDDDVVSEADSERDKKKADSEVKVRIPSSPPPVNISDPDTDSEPELVGLPSTPQNQVCLTAFLSSFFFLFRLFVCDISFCFVSSNKLLA